MSQPSVTAARLPVSAAVVDAVADALGVECETLPVSLFDAVDPDALDALFAGRGTNGTVSFDFCGRWVTVTGAGDVSVEERPR